MKILFSLYLVCTQDIIFGAVESQRRYRENPFAIGDAYLTPFYQRAQFFCRTHGQNNTRKCDTEGF